MAEFSAVVSHNRWIGRPCWKPVFEHFLEQLKQQEPDMSAYQCGLMDIDSWTHRIFKR